MSKMRSVLPFFAAAIIFVALGFSASYFAVSYDATNAAEEQASCEIPEDIHVSSPDISHERNLLWQAMNERPEILPKGRAARLGVIIAIILDPDSTEGQVNAAMNIWMVKGLSHLDAQEIQMVLLSIQKGDAPERLLAFKEMSYGDELAGTLINSAIADEERMKLFMAGEKIPYENGWSPKLPETPTNTKASEPSTTEPPEEAGYHQDLQEELEEHDE